MNTIEHLFIDRLIDHSDQKTYAGEWGSNGEAELPVSAYRATICSRLGFAQAEELRFAAPPGFRRNGWGYS